MYGNPIEKAPMHISKAREIAKEIMLSHDPQERVEIIRVIIDEIRNDLHDEICKRKDQLSNLEAKLKEMDTVFYHEKPSEN